MEAKDLRFFKVVYVVTFWEKIREKQYRVNSFIVSIVQGEQYRTNIKIKSKQYSNKQPNVKN